MNDMEQNFFDRLLRYINYKGETINSFNNKCCFSNGMLLKAIRNNKSIGLDKIEKIFLIYTDLNPNYLFLGEKMTRDNKFKSEKASTNLDFNCTLCKEKDKLVQSYRDHIKHLDEEIEWLRSKVK